MVVRVLLPLRDAFLWGLVPFLRTRGYNALPVHFLGKAATATCSTRSRCCCSATASGTLPMLAKVFGWAFAIWGTGLYWWAGLLYAWQVRTLMARPRQTGAGLRWRLTRAGPPGRRASPRRRR